jgi:hypothetical protein
MNRRDQPLLLTDIKNARIAAVRTQFAVYYTIVRDGRELSAGNTAHPTLEDAEAARRAWLFA